MIGLVGICRSVNKVWSDAAGTARLSATCLVSNVEGAATTYFLLTWSSLDPAAVCLSGGSSRLPVSWSMRDRYSDSFACGLLETLSNLMFLYQVPLALCMHNAQLALLCQQVQLW